MFWGLFFVELLQGQSAQIPQVQSGKIHRWGNFHSEFIGNRTVDIWTPSIIDDTVIAFDVIYMHDGQMLFDSGITWNHQEWHIDETLQSLIDAGKVPPTIVVGIHNGGGKRHSEFFPRKVYESMNESARRWCRQNGRDYSVASDSFAALSDAYLKFMVNELKPAVDSAFFVKKDRAHTFVGGSSMGGLISMYATCEYPEVFGGALCFSTHWPGVWQTDGNPVPDLILAYMKGHLPDIRTHKWYFDLGDQTLDALYPPLQPKVDALMHQKGYNERNWITRFFGGDDHSERSWSRRFGKAYGWLNPLH
jgi:enterochelin esterase-like enzyme